MRIQAAVWLRAAMLASSLLSIPAFAQQVTEPPKQEAVSVTGSVAGQAAAVPAAAVQAEAAAQAGSAQAASGAAQASQPTAAAGQPASDAAKPEPATTQAAPSGAAAQSAPSGAAAQSAQDAQPAQAPQPAQAAQPGQPAKAAAPANGAAARSVSLESVQKAFEKRFPEVEVNGVTRTPFPGLYEVRLGNDLVYVDAGVSYILQGTLIDAQRRQDLTAARLEELSKVPFASLPFDLAIKIVKGDGSRKMAIFEDPNCPYCKRLHETLQDVDNITVYSFMFPILSEDSTEKARNIWCAKDQTGVLTVWMNKGKVPPKAQCEAPLETLLALGRKLMVQGTPAIFFADGTRINGAVPLDVLNKRLDAQKG